MRHFRQNVQRLTNFVKFHKIVKKNLSNLPFSLLRAFPVIFPFGEQTECFLQQFKSVARCANQSAVGCVFFIIYQTQETLFHRDIQTPRRDLKIRRGAEYFELNSRCLDSLWNSVSSVWYIFSIETKTIKSKSMLILKDRPSKPPSRSWFPLF